MSDTETLLREARQNQEGRRGKLRRAIGSIRGDIQTQKKDLERAYFDLPKKWYAVFGKTIAVLNNIEELAWDLSMTDLDDQMNLLRAETDFKAALLTKLVERAEKAAQQRSKG